MIDPAMMGGPPPSISLPAPGGEPPAASGGEWPSDPVDIARKLLEGIRALAAAEPDDEDQAQIEKMGADMAKYLANQQKLVDSATGAGPGAKLIRKATRAGGGTPGY